MAKIKIISNGQSGKIQYIEGWWKPQTYEFYWEFGGGDAIAIVWFPNEEKWDATYPWARGRQKEIVTDMANKVRRKQAPLSKIEWADGTFILRKRF